MKGINSSACLFSLPLNILRNSDAEYKKVSKKEREKMFDRLFIALIKHKNIIFS